ncbi:hypothetical protein ACIBEJ_34285 [Nonomuraea sp. NPDC050790]|uniref:hypothetical protein n=1 Tax=Nonomuraea sp. NPDC050790 TaxID=3364371 RepID=UPI0037BAAD9B
MTVMPQMFAEIAFTKDASGNPLWQDVSEWTEWEKGVRISRRRSHELDEVQPGTLSLWLINTDGRFTAGRTSSPYYPNVTLNRPIRIRARWPGSVNLLLKGQAEGSNASLFSATTGTLATSATAPAGQTSSIRWSGSWTSGDMVRIGAKAITTATDEAYNVTAGVTYSARCQARRETNTASMAVRLRWYDKNGAFLSENTGTGVALTTSFQAVSVSATAPANTVFARLVFVATATGTSAAVLSSAWQFERAASPTTWVSAGNEYRRFTGFVDRWPHAWTNGVLGNAQITATDRQKLLSRDRIRQAMSEEMLATGPLCYYPLGEPQDSTQAGNVAATPQPDMVIQQSGTGGFLTFGVKGGPDGSTGVDFGPVDTSNGKLLTVPMLTTALGGGAAVSLSIWVDFGPSPLNLQNRLIFVDNGSDSVHLRINYNPSSNTLSVGARLLTGSAAGTTTSYNLDDNSLHHIVAVGEFVSGTLRLRAYIDGTLAFDTNTGLAGSTWPSLTRIRVGGLPGTAIDPPEMMVGHASHVAGWNTALTLTQAQAISGARDSYAGELSGTRAARIAAWAGVTKTAFDAGSSLMDRHPQAEQPPLAAFKLIAVSEAGLFFISGDDVATFHGRARRQLPSSASITLAADQCGPDLQFVMDDQLLINDVAVSRSGQTVTRVVDQSSIDENQGTYASSIDTLLYTDTEAIDRAAYTVTTYGHPQPRAGQISVDAHSLGTVWDQMLGSEIGQRIAVTGLPGEAPATSLELWCEGVEDVITDSTWTFRLDTSPVRDQPIFVLDDPTYGTLDNNYLGW